VSKFARLAIVATSAYRVGVSVAFGNLIRALVEGFAGTKREFAREATIAPSVLSRLLGGGRPPVTDVCLRIARTGGVSASVVLRTAGHGDTADLIERLYGRARVVQVKGTAADRALFNEIQALDPRARKAIRMLITYHVATKVIPYAEERPRRRSSVGRRRHTAAEKQSA
jgi:hypothetical protein